MCIRDRVLIEDKLLTEEQFVGTLAEQLGLEFVDLATYPVDPAAAALVSENLARRYLAMPIGWWEGRLIVAMADPSNVFAIDDIRTLTGAEVRQVVVTAEAVTAAINKYYRKDSEAEHVSAEAAANSAPMDDDRDRCLLYTSALAMVVRDALRDESWQHRTDLPEAESALRTPVLLSG